MKKVLLSLTLVFCLLLIPVFSPVNPKNISYAESENQSDAKAIYLLDAASGQVLKEENADAQMPVASIVKLMTILLTFEHLEDEKISLDDTVIVSENAAGMGGSQVFIENGGSYKLEDLLKSVIVASANDASVAIAEYIAGSEDNFVRLMNNKAKELNLQNTNYCNATGLPAVNQFSSAKDVAIVLKNVLQYPKYFEYSTIWIDKLSHSNNRITELVNTNKLIRYYKGCDGGKTGSTNEAGYCLAATAQRGDMRLIGVVLGAENAKSRFALTSELLNYGFNNFVNNKMLSKEELIDNNINIKKSKTEIVEVVSSQDIYYLQNKTDQDNIELKYEFVESISAPAKKGDVVGKVYLLKDNQVVKEVNLILNNDIEKASYYDNIVSIISNWSIIN